MGRNYAAGLEIPGRLASLNPFPTLLGGQFVKRNPEQMMIGDIGELKADAYLEHVSDSEGFSHQPKK